MSSLDKKKPSTSRVGGIRTLSDLNRPSGHDSDVPQEYYTGGEKRYLSLFPQTSSSYTFLIA
ncbi:UNVERIFIED_CONTAM: Plant UBX domain-containing protein 4 [Sesamum angustifolium]|uniref:Plant UBX domain-containing protein 4 n=1 Tax=Sesamum angustifolium TaxID=2727405 RepID=A0AAW2PAX6_9LAMI